MVTVNLLHYNLISYLNEGWKAKSSHCQQNYIRLVEYREQMDWFQEYFTICSEIRSGTNALGKYKQHLSMDFLWSKLKLQERSVLINVLN